MAELVYAFDLKSNEETRTGSSPVSATNLGVAQLVARTHGVREVVSSSLITQTRMF